MVEIKNCTTVEIARLLNVHSSTVARWIDEGTLKAFVTPGGHRRVNSADLLEFLKQHNMPLPPELASLEKKRILVVDDDPKVLAPIVRILKTKKGYETFTAVDGFQAGEQVSDHNPNLVILDIMLPGIDGFKVCKMIKERDKNIKVLAITGYNTKENRKKILDAGADAFLPKPFEMKKLIENVEALLGEDVREERS